MIIPQAVIDASTRLGRRAWPSRLTKSPRPYDRLEFARLERERRRGVLKELPVAVPIATAFAIVVNMFVAFGGDANQVRTVLSVIPVSQLALMWLTTLLIGIAFGFIVAAPEIFSNPHLTEGVRRRVAIGCIGLIFISTFALTIWYPIALIVAVIVLRAVAIAKFRRDSEKVAMRTWLLGGGEPRDMTLRRFWLAGRRILRQSLGDHRAEGPLPAVTTAELDQLFEKGKKREDDIERVEEESTLTDVAFRIAVTIAGTYFLTWITTPIPVTAEYLIEFESRAPVVGYAFSGPADTLYIVPRGERRIATIPNSEVKSQRVCTQSSLSLVQIIDKIANHNNEFSGKVDCNNVDDD